MKYKYIIKNFDGVQLYGNSSFSSFRAAWDYIYEGFGWGLRSAHSSGIYVVPVEPQ